MSMWDQPIPGRVYVDKLGHVLQVGDLVHAYNDGIHQFASRVPVVGFFKDYVVLRFGGREIRKFERNVERVDMDLEVDEGL